MTSESLSNTNKVDNLQVIKSVHTDMYKNLRSCRPLDNDLPI